MRYFICIALLAGCASANVTKTSAGLHTLRINTGHGISSPAIVSQTMQNKAAKICPGGWSKEAERYIPRAKMNAIMSPTVAVEWDIRCH